MGDDIAAHLGPHWVQELPEPLKAMYSTSQQQHHESHACVFGTWACPINLFFVIFIIDFLLFNF
jgi:hypothetical protein